MKKHEFLSILGEKFSTYYYKSKITISLVGSCSHDPALVIERQFERLELSFEDSLIDQKEWFCIYWKNVEDDTYREIELIRIPFERLLDSDNPVDFIFNLVVHRRLIFRQVI